MNRLRRFAIFGLLCVLTACSADIDQASDHLLEYEARQIVKALTRIERFEPSPQLEIQETLDDVAAVVSKSVLLKIFLDDEKSTCVRRESKTPLKDCWEEWRENTVEGRSGVDELVYVLAPWLPHEEVDLIYLLLPESVPARETNEVVKDEEGNSHIRVVPDSDVINGREDIVASIKSRLELALRARARYEEHDRFVAMIGRIPAEAASWADMRDLEPPRPLTNPVDTGDFDVDDDERRLQAILNLEIEKAEWNDRVLDWLARVEDRLDRRLKNFDLLRDSDASPRQRVQSKLQTLFRAGQVASRLYEFKRGIRTCGNFREAECLLAESDVGMLDDSSGIVAMVQTHPVDDINRRATFGLSKPDPVLLSTGKDSQGLKSWQASSRVPVSLRWEALKDHSLLTDVEQSRLIDFDIVATDVDASIVDDQFIDTKVRLSPMDDWRFWPINRASTLTWLEDSGLPAYVDVDSLQLTKGEKQFTISGDAFIPSLGGKSIASVPFSLPIDSVKQQDLGKLWESLIAHLILQTVKVLDTCNMSCADLTGSLPPALQEGFSVSDLAVLTLSPFQLKLRAHPDEKPAAEFAFTLTLGQQGQWRIDDSKLVSSESLLVSQLVKPPRKLRRHQNTHQKARTALRSAVMESSADTGIVADPNLLARLLTEAHNPVPLDQAVARSLVSGIVIDRQQDLLATAVGAELSDEQQPLRVFTANIARPTDASPDTSRVASIVSLVAADKPTMRRAQQALHSALLHDSELLGQKANSMQALVGLWIDDVARHGIEKAIDQTWQGETAISCLETPSGCPLPAMATTSAKLIVQKYLSVEVASGELTACSDLPSSLTGIEGPHLPLLMICASHFGIGEAEFDESRAEFVTQLNNLLDDTLEESWSSYQQQSRQYWQSLVDADVRDLLGSSLPTRLGEDLPRVTDRQLRGLVADIAIAAVKAHRSDAFALSAENIREATAERVDQWVVQAAEDVALAPAFQAVIGDRPIETLLAELEATPELSSAYQAAAQAELAWSEARESWLSQAKPPGVMTTGVSVDHDNSRVTVSAQLLPEPSGSIPIRYPGGNDRDAPGSLTLYASVTVDGDVMASADEVVAAVKNVQASRRRLQETFEFERRQLESVLNEGLGEVYEDYLDSCDLFVGNEAICRDPDAAWRLIHGSRLSDWPLEVVVALDNVLETIRDQARDDILAAGRQHLEATLGGYCESIPAKSGLDVSEQFLGAAAFSCHALKEHLSANLESIVDNCRSALQKSNGSPCLAGVHKVVVRNFITALDIDDKIEEAAWDYVFEQAIALDAQLEALPEWMLQAPVVCLDETDLSTRVALPGSCGELLELSDFDDVADYVEGIESAWRVLEADARRAISSAAKVCIQPGQSVADLPTLQPGVDDCDGTVIDSVAGFENYINNIASDALARLQRDADKQLNQVCVNKVAKTGIEMMPGEPCLSVPDLRDPTLVATRLSAVVEEEVEKRVDTLTAAAVSQMQQMAASYGVDVIIIDGEFCVDPSFFSGLQCADDFEALRSDIEKAWKSVAELDLDEIAQIALEKSKETVLAAANRQLSEHCGRFREALANSDLRLFGSPVELDFDGNGCPGKSLRVRGSATVAGIDIDLNAGLKYEDQRLVLDWQRLEINPTPETLVTKLIQTELDDVEVMAVNISQKGIKVRVRYAPKGFPWPVEATVDLGQEMGVELDLNVSFDQIWAAAVTQLCTDVGNYVRRERLEILPGATLTHSVDDFCVVNKILALKFRVNAELAEPLGPQPITVIVDSRSGITVETPDFRDLLAQNLANFLKLADVGIIPASPWYTTDDGLTLHLDANLPIPVVELKAETSLAISAKRIKFKSPVRLRINQWIDTATVSFGRFVLGYDPVKRGIELGGSATVTPGAANQHIFRVDGSATFNLEDQEILLRGSSKVASIIEVSSTTTRINFPERLFEHGVSSGPMLADIIRMQGSLKVQDRPGVQYIRANGMGELFGAKITSMSIGLGRRLDGEFNVYLNFLDVAKQRFVFEVDPGFRNPRVETTIIGLELAGASADIRVEAGSANARVTLTALDLEISQDFDSLADIDTDVLEEMLENLLKPEFKIRIGSIESGATLVSFEDLQDGGGSEDAVDDETDQGPLNGDEDEVEVARAEGIWHKAYRQDRRVVHYNDCWEISLGFKAKLFCKRKQRTVVDKIVVPEVRAPAALLGMNSFAALSSTDTKYRILNGNPLLQIAFNRKSDGARRYVIYDTRTKRIAWQGSYGCEGAGCYCFKPGATSDPPDVTPVSYRSGGGSSYLLVKADAGSARYAFAKNEQSLANASCTSESTSSVLEQIAQNSAEPEKRDAVGLYQLVLREQAIGGRSVDLRRFGAELSTHRLELASDGRSYLLNFDSLAPDYYWAIEIRPSDIAELRSFLADRSKFLDEAFLDVCETSRQESLAKPCGLSRFSRVGGQLAFTIFERGTGGAEQKLTLIPEDTSEVEGVLRAALELDTVFDSLFLSNDSKLSLFDLFIVELSARSIKRVMYAEPLTSSETKGIWIANYVDKNHEQSIRLANVAINDSAGKPLVVSRRWNCVKQGLSALLGVPPQEFANNPDADQYADVLLSGDRSWRNNGWKANPLGYMNLNCP